LEELMGSEFVERADLVSGKLEMLRSSKGRHCVGARACPTRQVKRGIVEAIRADCCGRVDWRLNTSVPLIKTSERGFS
jgi:hypothetical protein